MREDYGLEEVGRECRWGVVVVLEGIKYFSQRFDDT